MPARQPKGFSSLASAATLLCAVILYCVPAFGQTLTTGALGGTVTDATGAVIPHATVTVTSASGVVRTTHTGPNGSYNLPQLNPGDYRVRVEAPSFNTKEAGPITVAVSQLATLDFTLELGRTTQLVEVTAEAALLQTLNPNTTTNLSSNQLDVIPNPGSDLSYEANFAAGVVMNTTGGYGNIEFNGLPAVSNNFTIDGLDANDPFLNLNNSGATNLQLGLGAMQEVSINSASYSVDQGRMPAAQINYVTKSGTNNFHGNAWEIWNGSRMNAADYFINARQFESPAPTKPLSTVNEFGASLGGPIKRNKFFFFTDLEGTRIALPIVGNATTPSANYENYALAQQLLGGCDYVLDPTGCAKGTSPFVIAANSAETSFTKTMFNLYGNKGGTAVPIFGCPLNTDGSLIAVPSPATPNAAIPYGSGCANYSTFPLGQDTGETLWTLRLDHNINQSNSIWYRFQMDNGIQATYTDPINAAFDVHSIQPERSGAMGFTHTFSPNLVNQFNPGFAWYRAIFLATPQAVSTFPLNLYPGSPTGPAFTALGGEDFIWPQGRDVTQWQINDNLSWTKGKHDFKFGENMRRVLVSDHDYGFFNTPYTLQYDLPEFTYGITDYTIQDFPKSLDEPFGIVNLDAYAQDTFRATSKLTLTMGVRATWNSNPVNQQNLISALKGSFYDISHNAAEPLNSVLNPGLANLFNQVPLIIWQPRFAIAYQMTPKTVFRGGIGVFSDIFPASISDDMSENPPYDNGFNEGLFGLDHGTFLGPGVPGSAYSAAVNDNQVFLAGFSNGTLSCAAPTAPANCLPQVGLTAIPKYLHYPYDLEWSFGVQQELAANWAFEVKYQGTASRETPYSVAPNGAETVCPGCFSPWPYYANAPAQSPDPRFAGVTQFLSGANSSYNALQTSLRKRMSYGLNFEVNYTWAHCLDTISNGGLGGYGGPNNFLSPLPGELYRNYGPCDYDFRHVVNAFYTYALPFHSANSVLDHFIGGWQASGSVFFHGGQPISMQSVIPSGDLIDTSGPAFANLVPGQPLYNKANIGTDCVANPSGCVTTAGNVQWLNPNAFESVVDPSTGACMAPVSSLAGIPGAQAAEAINPTLCQFGDMQRNFLRGPHFVWSDFFLTKKIRLTERFTFQVSAQFFNVFNHPNFQNPGGLTAGVPGNIGTLTGFGNISSEASPPTGLLGSFLGGDTAVRMIALRGRIEF